MTKAQRSILLALILALGAWCGAAAQSSEPPKELVKYITEARKAGTKDEQIRRNAIQAGWPENVVLAVLQAASKSEKPGPGGSGGQPTFEVPTASAAAAPKTAIAQPAPVVEAPREAPASTPAPETTKTPTPAATTIGKRPEVNRGAPDDYQIGSGDVLTIMVWKEPDASAAGIVVRTDGKITMPLIKDITVAGMTLHQAEMTITEQLSKFLTAPDVVVMVTAINSKKVYVVGAVKKEGPIPFTVNMNVLQALSEAGGLTDYAKRKRIYVLRNEGGREFRLPFNYDAALRGEHMELNTQLRAGDTVIVPH